MSSCVCYEHLSITLPLLPWSVSIISAFWGSEFGFAELYCCGWLRSSSSSPSHVSHTTVIIILLCHLLKRESTYLSHHHSLTHPIKCSLWACVPHGRICTQSQTHPLMVSRRQTPSQSRADCLHHLQSLLVTTARCLTVPAFFSP